MVRFREMRYVKPVIGALIRADKFVESTYQPFLGERLSALRKGAKLSKGLLMESSIASGLASFAWGTGTAGLLSCPILMYNDPHPIHIRLALGAVSLVVAVGTGTYAIKEYKNASEFFRAYRNAI